MVIPTDPTGGVLALFAHPDDEQFGTAGALLRCAERGIPVTVLSATSGGAGEISDPALATPETLAEVREEELRTACALLGFQPPILLRYPDGGLAEADRDELVLRLTGVIRRLRPRVVLTFDANGGYGHPDHIAIHQASLAAWDRAGDAAYPASGGEGRPLPPHTPDKLYTTAISRSRVAQIGRDMEAAGFPPVSFGAVQTIESSELGTPDAEVTTVVPVDDLFERRWASYLAHRTQYGPANPFVAIGTEVTRRWLSQDTFRRLVPAPVPGVPLPDEADLWAGLPLPVASA